MSKDEKLLNDLIELRNDVHREGLETYENWKGQISRKEFEDSALNFAFYLALRRRDIRGLQEQLVSYGLSSLGRLQSKTIYNLDAVIRSLSAILNIDCPDDIEQISLDKYFEGDTLLQENSAKIFGKKPKNRNTSIMITLPTEAAKDYKLVHDLIDAGMNVARINCSHDNVTVWEKIIKNIKKASKELDKECKINMEIAGPKTRVDAVYSTLMKPAVKVGDEIFLTSLPMLTNYYDHNIVIKSTLPEVIPILKEKTRCLLMTE